MSKIDLVKTLLKYVGEEDLRTDKAIVQGAIIILDTIEDGPASPMEAKTVPEKPKKAEKSRTVTQKPKKPFDTGNLGALRRAGWSVAKIADEMGVSEPTIYKYMKQEGIE